MLAYTRDLFCILLISVYAVLGSPLHVRSSYAVKDIHNAPSRWTNIGAPPSDHTIRLTVALKHSHFDELDRKLTEGTFLKQSSKYISMLTTIHLVWNSLRSFPSKLWPLSQQGRGRGAGEAFRRST